MQTESVFTIGHGGNDTHGLLSQLKQADIQFLIDVRTVPYSRHQPEFSREALDEFLATTGIKYVYMGDLLGGIPADRECYTNGQVDYSKCRTKEFFIKGIGRIRKAVSQGFRVCLLCSEAKPWQCHRSKLIGAALQDEGITVMHLIPNGPPCTQEDVMLRLTDGQTSLFGESLMSRKVYR